MKMDEFAEEIALQAIATPFALFETLGPEQGSPACQRPFIGRQQEMYRYEALFPLFEEKHRLSLHKLHLEKSCDASLKILEDILIMKGLPKSENADDEDAEMTILKQWYNEAVAYQTSVEKFMAKYSDNAAIMKIFEDDRLCTKCDYQDCENSIEFKFTTRRLGGDFVFTFLVDKAESTLEVLIDKELFGAQEITEQAVIDKCGLRSLIREYLWKLIDEWTENTQAL